MKKRKTYEISVIDKTYSKTISDETKFYTSDTALELVFKLKETEYTFESAEIVLLNIDDRSKVTRPVAKVNNDFVYEIDDDIIPHYGEWRGQVRFEQGETYVSSPVKFRIENDLGNERPPQLSDVQSWVSLKRYADKLTDELKQAVLSTEGIEDTFNENETARQNKFETAEQSRQTTFETNESGRNETFESNETTRQSQELEREKAESQRQTTFDSNEASRDETFNANEVLRQENENTRQQAEQERQSAELIRVEKDSKRETEISELRDASFIKFQNSVKNGDFSKGTENWVPVYATLTDMNGGVRIYKDGTSRTMRLNQNIDLKTSNTYYVGFKYTEPSQKYRLTIRYMTDSRKDIDSNGVYSFVGSFTISTVLQIEFSGEAESGDSVLVSNVILLNLTDIFGAGNEPSKEVMDWIIKENGYFDELTLRRDDLQQYEINQLRKAVIALGGTI